jgi:threonine dehydratase
MIATPRLWCPVAFRVRVRATRWGIASPAGSISGRGWASSSSEPVVESAKDAPDPTGTKTPVSQRELDALPISFADISRAEVAIRGGVVRTTCERSPFISELIGANVYFKNEFRQFTGSFKERGARNAILTLKKKLGGALKGVIAASAGNHAQALAYHGRSLGVPATVVMPTVAPLAKVDKCRKFGARVIIKGGHIGEAKEFAETLVASEGLEYVNGYDDPPILAGAGTIGMEMIDDVPDVDVVVVPIGGAGLIAGISCAIKTLKPDTKVIGVEPKFCASYTAALRAGKPVPAPFTPTLADGLAVPIVGAHAFEVARHYVDECVLASEKCISLAVLRLLENEKVVVEGGGAAGLAALLPGGPLDRADMKGKTIIVPLCGGNIDTTVLGRVLDRGLAADMRLVNFYATVSDRPGGIAKLAQLLSDEGASIKDIYHERAWLHTSVDQVQVKCVVELQGEEHGQRVHRALLNHGYPVNWNVQV